MTAPRSLSDLRSRLQVPLWAALTLTVAPVLFLGTLLLRDVFVVQREAAEIARLTSMEREAVAFGNALRTSQVLIRDYARTPTPALRERLRQIGAEVLTRGTALGRDGDADSARTIDWQRLLGRRTQLLDSMVAMPPAAVSAWFGARPPGGTVDGMLAIVDRILFQARDEADQRQLALAVRVATAREQALALVAVAGLAAVLGTLLVVRAVRGERALRAQLEIEEARLERTFADAPTGMAIVALDGRLEQVNAALCDMLGYTAEELVGRTYGEITHPDDLAGDDAVAAQLAAGAIPRYEYEKRYVAKDGSPVPIMLHGSAVRRGDGTLEHFIAQVVDLRAQKAAQAASQNRKAELRSILDGAEDVVLRYDPSGRVTYVNPMAVRVTGRSAEDLVGRPLEELTVPPSLVPRWRETIRAVVERGEGRSFEFDYPAPDGTTRFFSVRMTPIRNLSGTITGVVEFSRDLTVLREAEQALREREAEFTALVESADDIIVRYDRSLTIRFTNPAATAATGIPADAMLGRHVRDIGLPPALETRWVEALEAVLRTGAPQALDYSFPDASGGLRHYQTRFTAGRGPDGTVESVYAISRDTTSLVQVSEELATREAELRSIVETTEDLVYRYDTDGRVRYVNPSVTRASGRPIGSYVGRTAREIIGDSPLTRRVHETLMRVVATGEAETMEYTMHRPTDASEHFYHSRFTAERTVDGRIIGVVALSRDITERRRIELERERLLDEVTRAQAAVKTLKGLLPTCAWCRRIKDDQGHWEQMEAYIARRTDAEFSHGLCPDCATKMLTE